MRLQTQPANAIALDVERAGPNYWDAYELRDGETYRRVARIALVDGAPMIIVPPGAAMSLTVPMLDAVRSAAVLLASAEAQSAGSTPPEDQPGDSGSITSGDATTEER